MNKELSLLIKFIQKLDGKYDKTKLANLVKKEFNLTKDRSVFYRETFAVRFSSAKSKNFSNTIISLSNLQKYDDIPFIVCLNTKEKNYLYLANSTFLTKVSHSSQELREDNIRGSINGSDILKTFNNLENTPKNFSELFAIHSEIGFDGNLIRLVEATNNISPSGRKFKVSKKDKISILEAPLRTKSFISSKEYETLKIELDNKVKKYKNDIILASLIDNVNVRGRIIEYIIAGEDNGLRKEIIKMLRNGIKRLPSFLTKNALGDFIKIFEKYNTATDIKTKVMIFNSAPKAYNLDKLLEFLAKEKSIFMVYFVGILPKQICGKVLISIFQNELRDNTHLLKHWAGRNSRGVSQFSGQTIDKLIKKPNNNIDISKSQEFLKNIMNL